MYKNKVNKKQTKLKKQSPDFLKQVCKNVKQIKLSQREYKDQPSIGFS